jgi:hypothetical protein
MKYFVFYPIYPNDKFYHLLPYGRWLSGYSGFNQNFQSHMVAMFFDESAQK